MLYDIRIRIDYGYDRTAAEGRQLLRLMPVALEGVQQVLSSRLTIAPHVSDQAMFRDFFGNQVTEAAMTGGHAAVRFTAVAQVERLLADAPVDMSPALARLGAEIASVHSIGPEAPHHFRAGSPRIAVVPEIVAYAAGVARTRPTVLGVVEALGLALHRDMTFDAEATTVDTPPDEAFARRNGVCQDFAQIMISGLRGIGVPAGYVSGLLRTVPPPGKPRLEGADAMHAWVMAWCGLRQGWIEYDPTNACFVTDQHITIARGRDYGDVSPVSGVLRIAGSHSSRQSVDVIPLAERRIAAPLPGAV